MNATAPITRPTTTMPKQPKTPTPATDTATDTATAETATQATTDTPGEVITYPSPVRIKPEAKDMGSDNLHIWAGLYGDLVGTNPFGGFLIEISENGQKRQKAFDRGDFDVLPQAETELGDTEPGDTGALTLQPYTLPPPAAQEPEVNLVKLAPAMAINSPTNPRRRRGLGVDSLRALADSLIAHGLVQPITVRPLSGALLADTAHMSPRPGYEIIAGERRWRAAQLAELATIPMLVHRLTDAEVLEIQLVENIEREDLDPMEEAEGFALLRDKLGYSVEQIANRMGKGRGESYVRKRMKLLDLTPESREAMFEGHLVLSTGLLVARYTADRQAEVVKFIKTLAVATGKGSTEPAPFRKVATELRHRFNNTLEGATFDTEDASLVPAAGACSTCPKRTGYHQALFDDLAQTGDTCTDAACFASKKEAHVQVIRIKAQADGLQVVDGEAAKAARPYPYGKHIDGFTRLEATAYTTEGEDGAELEVTYADALRAKGRKAPKPLVFIDPHTHEAVQVIPDDVAKQLLPEEERQAQAKASAPRPPVVDTRPPEVQAMDGHGVRRAAVLRCFDAIRTGLRTVDELRRAARIMLAEDVSHLTEYLGWDAAIEESGQDYSEWIKAKVDTMEADELGQVIAMAGVEVVVTGYNVASDAAEEVAIVQSYGIDVLALAEKVAEDLQRQRDGAKAAASSTSKAAADDESEEAEGAEA
jgi:ParB/RepB/Spo0J family partition protein